MKSDSNQHNFHVVIPSANDDAGIGEKYFSRGNINLLPLAHKTLIRLLVDDLKKKPVRKYFGDIHLVVRKELFDIYKGQFAEKMGVTIHSQSPARKRGILTTVQEAARGWTEPFFVIYGDTLVEDEVLEKLGETTARMNKEHPDDKWGVIVLVDMEDGRYNTNSAENIERSLFKPFVERNRCGYVIVRTDKIKDSRREKIREISQEDILDIIYRPLYPHLLVSETNGERKLMESGIMAISPKLWKSFTEAQEPSRDPLGLHSITNAARRSFIDGEVKITGIVIDRAKWVDINYPWELLLANDYILHRMACHATKFRNEWISRNKTEEEVVLKYKNVNLQGSGYTIVKSTAELLCLFKQRDNTITDRTKGVPTHYLQSALPPFERSELRYTHEFDADTVWGIDKDAIIDGWLVIPDPRENPGFKLYLGRGATIQGVCVFHDRVRLRDNAMVINSVLGNRVLVDSFGLVDHSIVMDGAFILVGSRIVYSILGEGSSIGGGSTIASCKLTDVANPSSKYYASTSVVEHNKRFGAIIGDGAKIGVNCVVQPGRKIGRESTVDPIIDVMTNLPERSAMKTNREAYGIKRLED